MKCPNCGTDLKEGYLYCEVCGEDIHIVPDFEPEIEYSINETLSGIVEEVLEEVPDSPKASAKKNFFRQKKTIVLGSVLLVLLVGSLGGLAIKQHNYHSVSYQAAKATAAAGNGNYETAVTYYKRALELQPENFSYRNALADIYFTLGNEEAYVAELIQGLSLGTATEDETATIYKKLIGLYESKEDYASINTLLNNTSNDAVRSAYKDFLSLPPEFSYQEGTYDEVLPLKLTSGIRGTIYYTLDGSIPNKGSSIYTTPIFLETGTYEICAMFINQYGIKSEVVKKTYNIEVFKPVAPEVEVYSGEYTRPVMITVLIPADATVYYTTDGTIPTNHSLPYTAPIPMPLGKSVFKFVTYSKEGVAGECTTRQYELTLNTDFTSDMAIEKLIKIMLDNGKITDASGTAAGLSGKYLYAFRYAAEIEDQGDFYVISEVYEDTAGVHTYTGVHYAVNIYTGEYFKVSKDASGKLVTEAFK